MPDEAVVSSNVPSPRLWKRRAGPKAFVTKRSGKPSPSTSPAATPGRRDALVGRLREARLFRDVGEVAVSVVAIEDRAHAVGDEEVLVPVPVEVEDGDAGARPDVRDQVVDELAAADRGAARRGRLRPCASWKRGEVSTRFQSGCRSSDRGAMTVRRRLHERLVERRRSRSPPVRRARRPAGNRRP